MNPNLDDALRLARLHDLARRHAQQLRREAIAGLFDSIEAAVRRVLRRAASARIGVEPVRLVRRSTHGAPS